MSYYRLSIPTSIKVAASKLLPKGLWHYLKQLQRRAAFDSCGPYSFDEPTILKWIDSVDPVIKSYVDIGAQDGVLGSQTLSLAKRDWKGVCFEADHDLVELSKALYATLPKVRFVSEFVTPENICELLAANHVPEIFGFLSLDIDSYDFFVLDRLLERYSPQVICVEINEIVPPPVRFAVRWPGPGEWKAGAFQGFSIQMAKDLCNRHAYRPVELHYNNLLLIKQPWVGDQDKDLVDLYNSGYLQRTDRRTHFPWNERYNVIQCGDHETAISQLRLLFKDSLDHCLIE